MSSRLTFRVVIYREEAAWIAHCLETDVVAEGKTPLAAARNLMDLALFQVKVAMDDGDLKAIFRQAPADIMHMYVIKAIRRAFGLTKADGIDDKEFYSRA